MRPGPLRWSFFAALPSAAVAYRADLSCLQTSSLPGGQDGEFLMIAGVLHAAADRKSAAPQRVLRRIVTWCRRVLGEQGGGEGPLEAQAIDLIQRVVSRMEDAGAFNLATLTLQSLAVLNSSESIVVRGRICAQAARIAWKSGNIGLAAARYRSVARLGQVGGHPELTVRAWIGYAVIARLRGNYPRLRYWSRRAATLAEREALVDLASLAYHSLMVGAGIQARYDLALRYAWRSYELSQADPIAAADTLLSVSQTLLDAGAPDAAMAGFSAVISRRPPMRIALPAIGGLALAAAGVGCPGDVERAARLVLCLSESSGLPYAGAAALVECFEAAIAVGVDGGRVREAALAIMREHAFNEFAFRLEHPRPISKAPPSPPIRRSVRTESVVSAVTALRPSEDLIENVLLASGA